MIRRYDSLITVINDKSMLALKFKIVDGNLYAFNFYLPEENREVLRVLQINGVDVSTFVNEIDSNDLYDIDKMKKYGIDVTNKFVCALLLKDKVIEYDILNENLEDKIFYKTFLKNSMIEDATEIKVEKESSSNNSMIDYASTNIKNLLGVLMNMCTSEPDKISFDSILTKYANIEPSYTNSQNNLDVIFLSTQLLLLDKKLEHIPEYILQQAKNQLRFMIDADMNINNAIMTNDEIDFRKLIIMIRNSLAHSNYRLIDEEKIEFYNSGKNKMSCVLYKRHIMTIFKSLFDYYFLNGSFPIAVWPQRAYNFKSLDSESLFSVLNDIEIIDLNEIEFKKFANKDEQEKMDNDLGLSLHHFNSKLNHGSFTKDNIFSSYEHNLKKHLAETVSPQVKRLSDEDKKYIISNIKIMGEKYFFGLGITAQKDVVNKLLAKRYNKEYYMFSNIYDIINNNSMTNNSLTKSSSDYINYKAKIELIILSLLNNIFLFCYNQNKNSINATDFMFPEYVYEDYLNSKKAVFYEKSREAADCRKLYTTLLTVSSTKYLNQQDYKNCEDNIRSITNKLTMTKSEIELADAILNNKAKKEAYTKVNLEIMNRIRDSLAHGKASIEDIDINNIMATRIKIVDEYSGNIQFESTIYFGDLIKLLNIDEFVKAIVNDNENFQKHLM